MARVRALGPTLQQGGGGNAALHQAFQQAFDQQGAQRATAMQGQLDAQTSQQFGVGLPTSAVSGAIQLPNAYRSYLRQYGIDPNDFQSWLNQQQLTGQDYQARVRMGQNNLPPVRDMSKLDQNTVALFGKVQAALSSAATDDQKTQVLRVAFGGPNGQQLAQEYGLWADAQRNTGVAGRVIGAVERNPVGHAVAGAFGNVLQGLGSLGALGRESIAVLLGSDQPGGGKATAGDIAYQAGQFGKAIPNLLTLGAAGEFVPSLKANDRAPGWAQIAETTDAPLWKQIAVSPLGTATGAARRSDNRWVRDLGNVLGMGMDVATDPASYVSFGSGTAGKAAVGLLGDVAERATVLSRLGVKGAELENLARRGGVQYEELLAKQSDDALKAARDQGLEAKIRLTDIAHKTGFKDYAAALAEETGANADRMFPRVLVGSKKDIIGLYSRGGVSLRGGVPFGPRFGVNLRTGTGALRGAKPLSAWFLHPGNGFTQVASRTLDQIAETFHYGSGKDRVLLHENRGLYNAVMAIQAQRGAVLKESEPLMKAVRQSEAELKRFRSKTPNANLWLYDMLENGQKSRYRAALDAATEYTPKEKARIVAAVDNLHAQIQKARDIAGQHGIDIATLRELTTSPDSAELMERYFPHKVRQAIGQAAGIAVAPTTVGPARARGVRAGTTLVGWAGNAEKLETGSYAEIQDVMMRLWGPDTAALWMDDPIKVGAAYINSVINAAATSHGYQLLADAGLIVPDLKNFAERSIGGAIPAGDPVRSAWAAPREQAEGLRAAHQALQGQLSGEITSLLDKRVNTLEQAAQMRETLSGLADRARRHDTQIGLLGASRDYLAGLEALARADYHQAVADLDAMFSAVRENTLHSVGEELRGLPEVKARLRTQINDLKAEHDMALTSLREDLEAKVGALHEGAAVVQQRMLDDIKQLSAQANKGLRPISVVREEIAATRQRLAQLEGGELAAATRSELAERALRKGAAARKAFVGRQRTAAVQAEELGSEIERAQTELRRAQRAGIDSSDLVTRLNDLQVRRAEALRRAETAGQQVSHISDMLSTAESAMRVADLREGQRLAAEAGASFDIGRGLTPQVSQAVSRLLRFHAADLAREEKLIIARAPEIKWTNEAAGWSREKLGAFGLIQPDGAPRLGATADRVNQLMDAQARQLQDQWRAAVGDVERTFQRTLGERKRQLSAALAREEDLQERAVRAASLDPRLQALSAAQKEGDQLNMFSAELDKDTRQLEAWIDNRDEIKKAMALTSAALREVTDQDQTLKNATHAAQALLEQDKAASGPAIARAFEDARIFELMAPHVEHAAAVAGKLPFVEGGVVMPRDIADVLVRLQRAPNYQTAFGKVLQMFNTRWKRGVLLNPGSVVRRIIGNVYNAVVLQGVDHESFSKAFQAMDLWHGAKEIDSIGDPAIRRYLKLAMEHNIFEGEISTLPVEGAPFKAGRNHPIQRVEEYLQQTALHGEDMARLAAFIHGLDAGMSPASARLWTGRYHFFNTELTERERTILRPAYPFYAYLRNNTALQVYTLFHNPGKIALYGYAAQDLSAPVEGQGAPSWVTQQGGFALPWHIGDGQAFLANTMLDTSSLAIPYNILGVGQGGEGGGLKGTSPLQGDLTSSLSPIFGGAFGLATGRDIRQGGESFSKQQANPKLLPILKAMGAVDDQGRINGRVMLVLNQLLPLLGNIERVLPGGYGGLTASQAEQQPGQVFTKGPGLQFVANTPRQQAAYLKGQGNVIDQTVPAGKRPKPAQLTSNARLSEALQRAGFGG